MSTGAQDDGAGVDVEPAWVQELIEREPDLQLIDVREAYEHEAGHIEGDRHLQLARLASEVGSIDGQRPVVFYCRVGGRSRMAAQALRGAGFEAYSMTGGLVRWAAEGRPLSPEGGSVADH